MVKIYTSLTVFRSPVLSPLNSLFYLPLPPPDEATLEHYFSHA